MRPGCIITFNSYNYIFYFDKIFRLEKFSGRAMQYRPVSNAVIGT